jgi:hypothetical protein
VAGKPDVKVAGIVVSVLRLGSNMMKSNEPVKLPLAVPESFEIVALSATVPALPTAKLAGVALGAVVVLVRQLVVGSKMPLSSRNSVVLLLPLVLVTEIR